jgi:hypothetical protein
MICFVCFKPITGQDIAHRHEWRRQAPDGLVRVFGEDAPDGKLREARGALVKLSHRKCFHADKKRRELEEARSADPSAQPRGETDWRHQDVVEVGELAGEGDGGHRGTGAAG